MHDPILRCDSCQKLVYVDTLLKIGACDYCGNRRMRNVLTLRDDEVQELECTEQGEDFVLLFDPQHTLGVPVWKRAYERAEAQNA